MSVFLEFLENVARLYIDITNLVINSIIVSVNPLTSDVLPACLFENV